jgi:nucleobase transporter 1/2
MSGPANAPPERAEVTTSNETETTAKSYEARAKAEGMRFTISDVPPLHMSVLFGFQHYFTMLGALVLIPLLVTPSMGATPKQTAEGTLPLMMP